KCLHKDPTRRYANAKELAEDLARFRQGEPIKARPIGRRERVMRWVRKRPAVAALMAVSALAAVALLVVGWTYNLHLQAALGVARDERQKADDERHKAEEARRKAEDAQKATE